MANMRNTRFMIGTVAGLAYFAIAMLSILTQPDHVPAGPWPATGWLVALLTIRDRTQRPFIMACSAIGSIAATWLFGHGIAAAVPMAVANIAEAYVAVVLFDRFGGRKVALDSFVRLGWFVLAVGIVGPAMGATIAATAAVWLPGVPGGNLWLHWYISHALSALAFTPVLSLIVSGGARRWAARASRRQIVEFALLLAATAGMTIGVFAQDNLPLLFLPILPMILTTFRAGHVGAAATILIIAVIGGHATLNGSGPAMMALSTGDVPIQLFELYLASAALTAFPVAADLDRRRTIYGRLRDSEATYRLLADNSTDIVLRLDPAGRIAYISPSVRQLLGYAPSALIGTKALRLATDTDRDLVLQAHRDMLTDPRGTQIVEHRARNAGGKLRWLEAHARAVMDGDDVTGIVAVVRDVSHRKMLEAKLERAAATDSLTGLANRRAFDSALDAMIEGASSGGFAGCVALFDLDHFKRVNDRHGHQIGDKALRVFSRIATGAVRDDDLVARLGGEEFGILLPGADIEQAIVICERIRATLSETQLCAGDRTVELTVSAGIAAIDPASGSAAAMHAADLALYRAKADGRDRLRRAA
ncbi:sensor domain-containing diguanylate cyclase [Sphingomonas sp. CFBP 13720]|uniref:sensor domain-containing diguanylate cyclase n=1 Tax=Sphingomonas sp. CFBP 13720 TaxID=2775302 RepID=UPI001785EB9B|nr:diguanylate cyclase [Sphingomonas sp. CFBP 13720]MBD8677465.1 diguanylate cyclase [Sphingomonas sp. CFBP 13720]